MPSFNKENNEYHENIDASDGIVTPGDFLLFVIYLFIPIATIIHVFRLFEASKKKKAILWIAWMVIFWVSLFVMVFCNGLKKEKVTKTIRGVRFCYFFQ